ncbi:MAG: hypothetical protein EXS27_00040 [Pedosphaera sp.]|nr:hypothetical protein [Pedosphaera sp.]
MIITKQTTAEKLMAYLRHDITAAELVDWSETSLMDGELDEAHANRIASLPARLGVADVRAFGLAWEDCENILRELGYEAHVEITAA